MLASLFCGVNNVVSMVVQRLWVGSDNRLADKGLSLLCIQPRYQRVNKIVRLETDGVYDEVVERL